MKPAYVRRQRRRPATTETVSFKKENQQEHQFFGESTHEPFFKPASVHVQAAAVQRKCAGCEAEDKLQRAPEKKEEEKVQRSADKKEEEKVMKKEDKKEEDKKEEEKIQRTPEKKEEEKVQRAADKKEEEQVQKKEAVASSSSGNSISNYIGSLNSKGSPLPVQSNHFFSTRIGYDFSSVKVHTDKEAAESARSVSARAYTVGNNIVFNEGQYNTESSEGKKLMAHELAHVVQQGEAGSLSKNDKPALSKAPNSIQRAGDPTKIPPGLTCPTSLATGAPAGTDLLFSNNVSTIDGGHTISLIGFAISWLLKGGTNNILIHGYASTEGADGHNWSLSCDRAQAVRSELIRLGVPPVRIKIVAHGESTDFGTGPAPNRRAVVSMSGKGFFPFVSGTLTPWDNFAGRSLTRFGVGEVIDLDFLSFPLTSPADFGGLEWHLASGGGALSGVTANGTATYTSPALASTVQLQLRVASGLLAGRVISSRTISIVEPSALRQALVPGSFPNFAGWGNGTIPAGTWGVGFIANEFILPRDVSFQGVAFSEGTVAAVVTPSGSFLFAGRNGIMHPANSHGVGLGGNITTGTPLTAQDGVWAWGGVTPRNVMGVSFCGNSHFLWSIPLFFSVSGGPLTPFAGGFTSDQHFWSHLFCGATAEKEGAGPVCRNMNGSPC